MLDGEPLADKMESAPYKISWDSNSVENGEYILTAVAWDAAENAGLSVAFRVIVAN